MGSEYSPWLRLGVRRDFPEEAVSQTCRMSRTWSDEKGGMVCSAGELPGQRPGTKREQRFGAGAALSDGRSMEC